MLRRTALVGCRASTTTTAADAAHEHKPPEVKTLDEMEWYGGWKYRPVSMFWFFWNTLKYSKLPNPQVAFELGFETSEARCFRVPLPKWLRKLMHIDTHAVVTSNVGDVGILGSRGGEYMIRNNSPPWPWDRFWPEWGWMPTSYAWLYGEETKRGVHLWRKDLLNSETAIERFGQPLAFHTDRFRREFNRTVDPASGRHRYWLELVCCSVFDQCTQMQTGQDTKWALRYDPDVAPSPRDWSKRVGELYNEVGRKPNNRGLKNKIFDKIVKFDFPECTETVPGAPEYMSGKKLLGDKSTWCKEKQDGTSSAVDATDKKSTWLRCPFNFGTKKSSSSCCSKKSDDTNKNNKDGKSCCDNSSDCLAKSGYASVKGRTDEFGNPLEPWTPAEAFYFNAEATLAQLTIDVNKSDPIARIFNRSEKYDRSKLIWETLFCESELITNRTWADQKALGSSYEKVPEYCGEDRCLWKDALKYRYSDEKDPATGDYLYKMRSPDEPDKWINIVMNHRRITMLHVEIVISTFDPAGRLVENLLYGCVKHPQYQDRIAAECKPVLDDMAKQGKFTLEHWEKLKFTKAFACEFLRTVPLFNLHSRIMSTPQQLADGTLAPNGTLCIINYAGMCRDENNYPEAEQFKPERFMDLPPFPPHGSPESEKQSAKCPFAPGKIIKSDAVCPFGVGERVCSGIGWARVMTLLQFASIMADYRVKNDFALNTKLEWLNSVPNRPYPRIDPHFVFERRHALSAAEKTTTEATTTK